MPRILLYLFIVAMAGAAFVNKTPAQQPEKPIIEYAELIKGIESAALAEKESLERLEEEHHFVSRLDRDIATEINSYKVQLSSNGNLLAISETTSYALEKAWIDHRAAMEKISGRLKDLKDKRNNLRHRLDQAEEQYTLNEKQLFEINTDSADVTQTQTLVERLQVLIRLLGNKIQLLENIDTIYALSINQLEKTHIAFSELSVRFDQQVKIKKTEELFKRKDALPFLLNIKMIKDEADLIARQLVFIFSKDFWKKELFIVWTDGAVWLISFLLIFIIIQILLFKLRKYFFYLAENDLIADQHRWMNLVFRLFYRSLPLLGTALLVYLYANIRNLYITVPVIRIIFLISLCWLFSKWALDFILLWNQQEKNIPIPQRLTRLLNAGIIFIRYFTIGYIILHWLLWSGSLLLLLGRLILEITFMILNARLWRIVYSKSDDHPPRPPSFPPLGGGGVRGVMGFSYLIILGGFLLELTGYGSFALFWYASWGQTLIVLLWAYITFMAIYEWDRGASKSDISDDIKPVVPIRWAAIKLCWAAWFAMLIISLIFAWGARHSTVITFFSILNRPISVGGMNLTIFGFFYAFLILIFTHAAATVWRHTIIKTFLVKSGLDAGLQHSISTIFSYVFWALGILIALNLIGISTASLAVVFGALGIGLGFGLQNIFNNFISGIILLFERPIQVGDDVEVNGIWGEVRKINIRSTLVQTYDNATLIIPNSEFISNQVKNWTFKDPRVRRTINIGVAYGSDVELVRQLLLEIADHSEYVLKYPRPSVLFSDFGDSALMFKLRIWTNVDNCLNVESSIRFKIDHVFREKRIEIPFPQRDVHIIRTSDDLDRNEE